MDVSPQELLSTACCLRYNPKLNRHPTIYFSPGKKIKYYFGGDEDLARAATFYRHSCSNRIVFRKIHTKFHFVSLVTTRPTTLPGTLCAPISFCKEPRCTAYSGHNSLFALRHSFSVSCSYLSLQQPCLFKFFFKFYQRNIYHVSSSSIHLVWEFVCRFIYSQWKLSKHAANYSQNDPLVDLVRFTI